MAKKTLTVDFDQLSNFVDQREEFIKDNPWLIPAGIAIQVIPLALLIHGHMKTSIYKKKLQIEREKTKQLALQLQAKGRCKHHHHGQPKHHQEQEEPKTPAFPRRLAHH